MNKERDRAFAAVNSERDYQDAARGNSRRHPEDEGVGMPLGEYVLYMEDCLSRARASCYSSDGVPEAMAQIRKVSALGVAAMEKYGAPLRAPNP